MKKVILSLALLATTSVAFANTPAKETTIISSHFSQREGIKLNFTITGSNQEVLKQLHYLQTTNEFDGMKIMSCSITIYVAETGKDPYSVTFTADDCPAAAKRASAYLTFLAADN